MDINELKSRIKSLRLDGCYVFAGEEDYLKRYYLSSIRDTLVGDATLAAFNHAVFEGAQINFAAVQDAIKALTPEEQAAIAAAQQAASDAAAGN